MNGELLINNSSVYRFCANLRTKYKSGVWDLESATTEGVFKAFHDFLEQTQFPFTGLILLMM